MTREERAVLSEIYERYYEETADSDLDLKCILENNAERVETIDDYVAERFYDYLDGVVLPTVFTDYKSPSLSRYVREVIKDFCTGPITLDLKSDFYTSGKNLLNGTYYITFDSSNYVLDDDISETCDLSNCAKDICDARAYNEENVVSMVLNRFGL